MQKKIIIVDESDELMRTIFQLFKQHKKYDINPETSRDYNYHNVQTPKEGLLEIARTYKKNNSGRVDAIEEAIAQDRWLKGSEQFERQVISNLEGRIPEEVALYCFNPALLPEGVDVQEYVLIVRNILGKFNSKAPVLAIAPSSKQCECTNIPLVERRRESAMKVLAQYLW